MTSWRHGGELSLFCWWSGITLDLFSSLLLSIALFISTLKWLHDPSSSLFWPSNQQIDRQPTTSYYTIWLAFRQYERQKASIQENGKQYYSPFWGRTSQLLSSFSFVAYQLKNPKPTSSHYKTDAFDQYTRVYLPALSFFIVKITITAIASNPTTSCMEYLKHSIFGLFLVLPSTKLFFKRALSWHEPYVVHANILDAPTIIFMIAINISFTSNILCVVINTVVTIIMIIQSTWYGVNFNEKSSQDWFHKLTFQHHHQQQPQQQSPQQIN